MGIWQSARLFTQRNATAKKDSISIPSSLSFVWLNDEESEPMISSSRLEFITAFGAENVASFNDDFDSEYYIRSSPLTAKLIYIVQDTFANEVVSRVHNLCQIVFIFVLTLSDNDTRSNDWILQNNYSTFTNVQTVSLDQLVRRLKAFQAHWYRNIVESSSIEFFRSNDGIIDYSSTGINGTFMFGQLLIYILIHMSSSSSEIKEFVIECAKEFENKSAELKQVKQFYDTYQSETALQWYTKPTFVYLMLNRSLRTFNIDVLYLYRFFIRDVYRQLTKHQCQSRIRVYRGQRISLDELEQLHHAKGQLISMNSFLSTSLNRQLAEFYVGNSSSDENEICILMEIDADPMEGEITTPFADISKFSEFPDQEQEILFMLGSVFRVQHIRQENNINIVSLTLCKADNHELSRLLNIFKHEICIDDNQDINIWTLTGLLLSFKRIDTAEKFIERIHREILFENRPNSSRYLGHCYLSKAKAAYWRCQYDTALEHLKKALVLYEKDKAHAVYLQMGMVFSAKNDFKQALQSYEEAIKCADISRDFSFNCCDSIGKLYRNQKEFNRALYYHQKGLEIAEKSMSNIHPQIGVAHASLAAIYCDLEQFNLALEHGKKALEIHSKVFPVGHTSLAIDYFNLSVIYGKMGDGERAWEYRKKGTSMKHPKLIRNQKGKIEYPCPGCHRVVWIYTIFKMFKGSWCFMCIGQIIRRTILQFFECMFTDD